MTRVTPTASLPAGRTHRTVTLDIAAVEPLTAPDVGTAEITVTLADNLLVDLDVCMAGTSLAFTVTDPVNGLVEPVDGAIRQSSWSVPVIRVILDNVGVGLRINSA